MTIIGRIWLLLLLLAPSLLSAQQQQQSGAPERNSQFVVFIHAGDSSKINDQVLREIGILLVKKGYVVRTPDRERDLTGGPGVDYFSSFARDAAQDVADTINARVQQLLPNEKMKLEPRLQRINNPPTYLGVWLF
jgi:hypothetical protein